MNPEISIIIPVYNAEEYISVCLNQILKQTFRNFEVILVDDGSTDNSLEECEKMAMVDPRIHIVHQKNGGVASARNTGLDIAKGKFIAFVDADDIIAPNYLYSLFFVIKEKNVVLSMCSYIRIYDYNYEFFERQVGFSEIPAKTCAKRLLSGHFPVGVWGILFKKNLIRNLRFPVGIKNNEDKLFLYQYLLNNEGGRVLFTKQRLYGYYMRSGSASQKNWNGSLDVIFVADRMHDLTMGYHQSWIEISQSNRVNARLKTLKSIILSGEKTTESKTLFETIKKEILSIGVPKNADRTIKVEFMVLRMGSPVYFFLVVIYYNLFTEKVRDKRNEKALLK